MQKIKELTYMHSEGILSGELKHGPLAMIDKDMPCIMLITKDNTYKVRSQLSGFTLILRISTITIAESVEIVHAA